VSKAHLRDLDRVGEGLVEWLRARRSSSSTPVLEQLTRPESGLANETIVASVQWPGGERERMVLRLPPIAASFPDTDLHAQARVQEAAAGCGIPAPSPTFFEPDERWIGTAFLAMPFVEGRIPSQVPAFDDWIVTAGPAEQERLGDELLGVLAGVHHLDWEGLGLGDVLRGAQGTLADELAWWEQYVTWATDGGPVLPALADALAWCRRTMPGEQVPRSLLWGDARLGNLVVDADFRVVGVLDWETASIGPAEMDIAWYLALDGLQQHLLGQVVPGIPGHDELIDRHEQELGRPLIALGWHEVFALVRALAISNRQARLAQAAGQVPDLPADDSHPLVGAIGRAVDAADR
jgi:aminoglycoside phosphotransferase (APT) family kinase protein